MTNPIILETVYAMMGEEKPVSVIAKHRLGVDLSLSTATFEVWDEAGTQILSPDNATLSGDTELVISYQVDFSATGTIPSAGNYRGIFRHDFGSAIRECQIPIVVYARPA